MDTAAKWTDGYVDPRQLSWDTPPQPRGHLPRSSSQDMTNTDVSSDELPDFGLPPDLPELDWTSSMADKATGEADLNKFFLDRGACFAPVPCSYCRRHRLQCLIMQTGPANPNPERSCSTCVGLFRGCSLASGQKRQPAGFETSGPVIGQLHGVNEESSTSHATSLEQGLILADMAPTTVPVMAYDRDKRPSSRRYQKTRLLRGWFDTHPDHPYPTGEDVDFLSIQSGLTKTQVNNWFTNARRRQRQTTRPLSMQQFRAGSPMPQIFSSVSPIDRWRNSPPEDDHVSPDVVASAIASSSPLSPWSPSLPDQWQFTEASSQGDSASASMSSMSSCLSHRSASRPHSRPQSRRSKARSGKIPYQCTFCRLPFKKKHDWARHERAVHMPELETYTCTAPPETSENLQTWRFGQPEPECGLCGHTSPDAEHFALHDFDSCSARPLPQRTFCRKDHFWQHLSKYHGCHKWEGWDVDLNLWRNQHDTFQSSCGFCGVTTESWTERVAHLADHFKAGLTMESWQDQSLMPTASPESSL